MAKSKKKSGNPNYFIVGLIVFVLFIAAFFALTWDWPSHKQEDLIGQWYYDTSELNIETDDGGHQSVSSTYWTFAKDGAFTLTNASSGTESTGTYAIDGKAITISFPDSDPEAFEFVIKGDTLTLNEGADDAVTLTQVK